AQSGGPIHSVPCRYALPMIAWPPGDHTLRVEIRVDGQALATHEHTLSVVPRLSNRLRDVRAAAAVVGGPTTERVTLRALGGLLRALANGWTFEPNYPAARLMAEAESLAGAIQKGGRFYGPERSGQFWLTLPAGRVSAPVRLQVPKGLTADKPVPLVVALH